MKTSDFLILGGIIAGIFALKKANVAGIGAMGYRLIDVIPPKDWEYDNGHIIYYHNGNKKVRSFTASEAKYGFINHEFLQKEILRFVKKHNIKFPTK